MADLVHLGERVRPGKYGLYLARNRYAEISRTPTTYVPRAALSEETWAALDWAYADPEHTTLSDEYCEQQRADALENFDLNIAFFAQISEVWFNGQLDALLRKNRVLRPVVDLTTMDGVSGVYVMVFDEYRQVYIGTTDDLRKRIRGHWRGTKSFDRLLWGDKTQSILSVDSFRPLDTTRLYAAEVDNRFAFEAALVQSFPRNLLLNRIAGGDLSGFRGLLAIAAAPRRQLT